MFSGVGAERERTDLLALGDCPRDVFWGQTDGAAHGLPAVELAYVVAEVGCKFGLDGGEEFGLVGFGAGLPFLGDCEGFEVGEEGRVGVLFKGFDGGVVGGRHFCFCLGY